MIRLTVVDGGLVRTLDLEPGAVEAFRASLESRGGSVLERKSLGRGLALGWRRPNPEAWSPWFSALARTLKGGVPLDKALELLADASPQPEGTRRIHRAVVGGQRFSASVAEHLEGLPELVPALLKTGEAAGDLARGASLAHRCLQDLVAFRRELRARLAYPLVVVSSSAIALTVLMVKVFPAMSTMWTSLNKPLPGRLQAIRILGWFGIAGLALLALGLGWLMQGSERAQRLPGFRDLGRHRSRSEAWAALAMALGGGVSLLDALGLLGERWGAADMKKALQGGARPEQVLGAWVDDAPGQRAVLLAGLRIGDLAGGAQSAAEGYRELLEQDLQRLQRWIEPVILLLLGAILLGLAWSLFSLMGEMEHGLVR